jgi:hypothetical protein
MGGHDTPAPAGWLAIATLPKGERYIVVPPGGQPLDHERATSLAGAVDWHGEVHAVGEAARVWRASGWDPEQTAEEQYRLPAPWETPPPDHHPDGEVLDELAALFRADTTTGGEGYDEVRRMVAATGRDTVPIELEDSGEPDEAVYYLADGQPCVGTLRDYAHDYGLAQVGLLDVPEVVWTWSVVLTPDAPGGATWGWTDHPVEVTTTDEGYLVTVRALDQQVRYRLGDRGGPQNASRRVRAELRVNDLGDWVLVADGREVVSIIYDRGDPDDPTLIVWDGGDPTDRQAVYATPLAKLNASIEEHALAVVMAGERANDDPDLDTTDPAAVLAHVRDTVDVGALDWDDPKAWAYWWVLRAKWWVPGGESKQ